jgi:hypothetical protein
LNLLLLFLLAILTAPCPALSQNVISVRRIPKEWQDFRPRPDEPKLRCSVTSIRPRLNFSFRFQTGYVARFPGSEYVGKGHWIATFFRVTPDNSERQPVYFVSRTRIPEVPPNKTTLEVGGGFVVGEGKYRVDWLLTDDSGRVCTDNWTVNAKLGRKERDAVPGMPAGTADEISFRRWTRASKGAANEDGSRVTLLVNASPMTPRRVRLGGYDRVLLLSSVASLLERLPLRSVRLVVFSLDQQREIYRNEDFTSADFDKVSQALSQLELGTVDYDILNNRMGHIDLLTELIGESMSAEQSDAVLFVGPKPRQHDKVGRSLLPERVPGQPPVFYVQFRPFVVGPNFPDVIMNAVKQMGGKTFNVFSPGDFAEAILQISRTLDQSRRPAAGL